MVGIIVKLQDDPVVAYRGIVDAPPTDPRDVSLGRRISRGEPAVRSYRAQLAQRHAAFEATVRAAVPAARVTHRFDVIVGGVAMRLPADQIVTVARLPGVKAVYRDPQLRLHTDTSPQFIGAAVVWGNLQGFERAGEGVIVGVLDSGVWPEHPSFQDPDPSGKPYFPPPAAPFCEFSGGANPGPSFACNNKLIGAYRFMSTYDRCVADGDCLADHYTSARDSNGHGTHTASTAAGNAKVASSIFGIDRKQVSGVAPRAHVIAYKVCGPDACWGSDSVAAIQQAILDGVEVINFSISGGIDPYNDIVELGFLDAYRAGVFVAASAGNEGPLADTVNHRGPWVTTVAASMESRRFQATLTLVASDGERLRVPGTSITPGIGTPRPVIIPTDDRFCTGTTAIDLTGAFVLCAEGGGVARQQKSYNLAQRQAVGMVLHNTGAAEQLLTDNHFIPTVHISKSSADALEAFVAGRPSVTASLSQSVARHSQGDVMAAFSSRGGTMSTIGIAKPDLTAPGVQILAGQTPSPDTEWDPAGQLFQAIAGTSMSSPHLAGAAALLRQLNPEWTPGRIKSALMTTASASGLVREDRTTPFTPFDAGSGRVSLHAARSPLLTFDAPATDFVDRADDLWNVNYPSVYVPDLADDVLTVRRTAQSSSPIQTRWTLTVLPDSSPGLSVSAPAWIDVPPGGQAPFDIRIDKSGIPAGEVRHAILELASGPVSLRMPVSAAGPVLRPDLAITFVAAPADATRGSAASTSATVTNIGNAPAGAFYVQFYLSQDTTVSADDTPYWFCNVGSLAAGASQSCNANFAIPSSIDAGDYFLVVNADDGGTVFEGNEKNNVTAAGPIKIK